MAQKIEELKAAALAATPGPWLHRFDPGNPKGAQHGVKLEGEFGMWVFDCLDNADKREGEIPAGDYNAQFIAAANPAAILGLIAHIDSLTEELALTRAEVDAMKIDAERAGDCSKPTDISASLREYAGNPGYAHNDYADVMRRAADECDRFYGGMMAWKQTAETKDRKLGEEITARINERVEARLRDRGAPDLSGRTRWAFANGNFRRHPDGCLVELDDVESLLAAGKAGA